MSCIVLIGGIIGCGKSTLINFFHEHESELFDTKPTEIDTNYHTSNLPVQEPTSKRRNIHKIIFDDFCSIQEQADLMKTIKGWRNFRIDLLMAAEHFICSQCGSEDNLLGPLTERSQNLLNKLELLNSSLHPKCEDIFFVEDNFYYRSMRYDWLQIARRANVGFCEVFLQCPLNIAIQRNSIRGYQIPPQKIQMMLSTIEFPNPEKYKWEKYSTVLDSSGVLECSLLKKVVDVIKEAASHPAEIMLSEEKIESQIICSKNAVHQADKILRKIISRKILESQNCISNEEDLKFVVSTTVDLRQDLLSSIRQGYVHLPKYILEKLQKSGIDSVQAEFETQLNEIFENAWLEKIGDLSYSLKNVVIENNGNKAF